MLMASLMVRVKCAVREVDIVNTGVGVELSLLISHPHAYEDGTDTVFRNVGY
jgi:hypothetical protein